MIATHVAAAIVGFGAGIYSLPILTVPPARARSQVRKVVAASRFSGELRRDLEDSDAPHWGEGTVFVGRRAISLGGRIAPGMFNTVIVWCESFSQFMTAARYR